MTKITNESVSRRTAVQALGVGIVSLPFLNLLAWPKKALAQATQAVNNAAGLRWAEGTTALLKASYPSPFTSVTDTSCVLNLTCQATLGPCYGETQVRKDISEDRSGIPMRLALRILNDECQPIAGATVDVWHTSAAGFYSGADTADMCTLNDEDAESHNFFRGVQSTNDEGIVEFDSCFPGWYTGRTIHIHYTVRVGETEFLTSQLFFDDTITDDIVANYADYSNRGERDTTNQNDGVVSAEAAPLYCLDLQRMEDGAMLASKTIIVRSSTGTTLCTIPGGTSPGGGPGGPGGPGGTPPSGTPPTGTPPGGWTPPSSSNSTSNANSNSANQSLANRLAKLFH